MTYTNPRKKLVNQIKDIAAEIGENYGNFYESKLLSICHELLKEKRAKKLYLSDYAKLMFINNKEITDVTCHYSGYANTYHRDGSITGGNTKVSYPNQEKEEIEELEPLDYDRNLPDQLRLVVNKLNQLVREINILKSK